MNFKKNILFFLVLFITYSLSAQKNGVDGYLLNPQQSRDTNFTLKGPDEQCSEIPIRISAIYQQEDGIIEFTVFPLYTGITQTHLWFPLFFSGEDFINNISIDQYFRRRYDAKIKLNKSFKRQIEDVDKKTFHLDKAIQCVNGQFTDNWNSDIILSLSSNQPLKLHIKVLNENQPVTIKLQNIVPLKAKKDFTYSHNKIRLAYIAKEITISYLIPANDCFGLQDQITQYKQLTHNLKKNYLNINQTSQQNDEIEFLKLYLKYRDASRKITETSCEELAHEYNEFSKYFQWVEDKIITPDSIDILVNEMTALVEELAIAVNTNNGKRCKQLLPLVRKYDNVNLNKNTYNDVSDPNVMAVHQKVLDFLELKKTLNEFKSPGNSGYTAENRPVSSCSVSIQKIVEANAKINNLFNEYLKKKTKNREQFSKIVQEADSELRNMSSSCKKNNKTIIQQYADAKKAYQDLIQ